MREIIYLSCGDCKRRTYISKKDKRKSPEKLSLKKFCRFCGKHTLHKETK
ncbi:MAG: 50S ribosomal protein L33 [candidate division FCPU426 bacterium]